MLSGYLFAAAGHSGQNNVSLQDVINIAKANFEKIQDIEFTFSEKRFHEKPGKLSTEYTTQTSWAPEKSWEMQISKIEKVGSDNVSISSNSWDGDRLKSKTELLGEDGSSVRKEGRITNKRATLREDILSALKMKGHANTYITYLTADYVSIEGTDTIDGRKVIVVNRDYTQGSGRMFTRYYVDLERGAIPLKCELHHEGQLLKTVENIIVAEVEKGLFLPVRGDVYFKARHDGKHKTIEYNVDIKSIKINQGLEKEYFDIEFEHNMPVLDQIAGINYYYGVGLEPEREVDEEFFDQLIKETESVHAETNQSNKIAAPNAITTDEELPSVAEDVEQENMKRADVGLKKKHPWLLLAVAVVVPVGVGALILERRYIFSLH